jgi:phosphoribosylglycinamide formyltransferase-1
MKFAIYASGNASTILNFYQLNNNLSRFPPTLFIYDGNNSNSINLIKTYFKNYIFLYDAQLENKERINNFTSNAIHELLNKHTIDYLLVFGDKIFKNKIINCYKNKIINFHPSILPAFKGLNAVDQALQYNVRFLGNSVHYIDEGIDTGDIIAQSIMKKHLFKEYKDIFELQFPLIKLVFKDILCLDENIDIYEDVSHTNYLISW